MLYRKLKFNCIRTFLFITALGFLYGVCSQANEDAHGGGGHEAAPAHGESGGEHEGAADEHGGAKKAGKFIKKDEYLEVRSAIDQSHSKIRSQKELIKTMLDDKEHIKDPAEYRESTQKIKKAYLDLQEMYEALEKNEIVLRYRYPDRGASKKAAGPQSLEEISDEAILDKNIEKTTKYLRHQYRVPASESSTHRGQDQKNEDTLTKPIRMER